MQPLYGRRVRETGKGLNGQTMPLRSFAGNPAPEWRMERGQKNPGAADRSGVGIVIDLTDYFIRIIFLVLLYLPANIL